MRIKLLFCILSLTVGASLKANNFSLVDNEIVNQSEHDFIKKASLKPSNSKVKYTDNGDGTVSDASTGLMWKQCSEGLSGNRCKKGEAKQYNWDEAMLLKGTEFANYNNWVVPTNKQLRTLVYCSNGISESEANDEFCYGKNNRGGNFDRPTINEEYFPETQEYVYWSSSQHAIATGSAWNVYFDVGYGFADPKSGKRYVRLVRAKQ